MMHLMELENCISDKRDDLIDMIKLKNKIKVEKAIDIDLFNQLLKSDCLFKVESINHKLDWEEIIII